MSGSSQSGLPYQRRDSMGPSSAGGISTPQATAAMQSHYTQNTTQQANPASKQNLDQIVLEYLLKKGYYKTESMLRQEAPPGSIEGPARSNLAPTEDKGLKYRTAFNLLYRWSEDSMDVYKAELRRLLWPVFVYSFLQLVTESLPEQARRFYDENSKYFTREHSADLQALETVRHADHIEASNVAKLYKNNKYRLSLTQSAYQGLISFLESKEKEGGGVIQTIIQNSMQIMRVERAAPGVDRSFATMIARLHQEDDIPDEDEGIPGHNPGSANTDRNAPNVLTRVNLGPMPMETDMANDVRDELEELDVKQPPLAGAKSLVSELDQKIKREPSEDAPSRENIPLPKPLARDVTMEVQRIREHRDRLKIPPHSEGPGPLVSVVMYTFHNTFDSVNCIDISGDNLLVAAGTAESYIRVWSLEGKPLTTYGEDQDGNQGQSQPSASRRLVGHSGPVYSVSFSPSVAPPKDDPDAPSTTSSYLLSASADKTIRLWSLDTFTNLVVYKGHDSPVWSVAWGPFGHYFVTGSHDRTGRLWSTDHIAPLRIFAGHDQDVDVACFHPNNAYVFTGSSDKTVRMWDVSRGSAVRIFTGHTSSVTALACSPSGRQLASADDAGSILLWDLSSGRRLKRMRGHGKGGIWSLSWSAESSLLVSGGMDHSVRVWDVLAQTDAATGTASKPPADQAVAKTEGAGGAPGGASAGTTSAAHGASSSVAGPAASTAAAGKKGGAAGAGGSGAGGVAPRGRDAMITSDQVSAFATKKTPVYLARFTNMNLVLASGAYLP